MSTVQDDKSTVRPASANDALELAAMNLTAWRGANKGILPDKLLADQSSFGFETAWRASLANPSHLNFVFKRYGQITGFASLGPCRDAGCDPLKNAEVYGIYLLPEYWGQGHGWALWRSARARLSQTAFESISLWVLERNTRARKFFERIGFSCDAAGAARVTMRDGVAYPEQQYRMALG